MRVQKVVAAAVSEAEKWGGEVIIDRSTEELPGHSVGPVLIELPLERAINPESFAQQEIFGPVVHIVGVDKARQALEFFNSTDYGLTGGIFSPVPGRY